MPTPLVSLCRKEHSCQLAALCKNLLGEDFLVDCTIAAEGQKLKAHRLILSACSPYFRMLFSEDAEKHPIVFLKDTLFDTLKAVIDFIYRGEIQIPADKLEAFLALSESLQIKGLHNSCPKDRNKNLCPYVIGNVVHSLPKDNQSSSGLQGTSGVSDLSAEISSQQHHPHLYPTGWHRDAVRSESSASCEEYSESYEDVRSASMVMPLLERQIVPGCDDQALDADITVKNEQLHSLLLETNSEVLGNIENSEHMSGNYGSEINEGTTAFSDQVLNNFSSGIVDLASVMPPQQQQVMQFPHEGCSGLHPTKEHEPMDSVLLVPKSEEMDDAEREESMNVHCTPENDTNEGTHFTFCEPNLNQCSSAVETLAARPAPQLGREGRPRKTQTHNPPDKQPHRSSAHADTSGSSPAHLKNTHRDERSYPCDLCGASFRLQDTLKDHKRRHKTDRPFLCQDCGASFAQFSRLKTHLRTHTGERPFRCDITGTSFARTTTLIIHKRTHTRERPFRCDICGTSFMQSSDLKAHRRTHTGERPFRCDICEASFAQLTNLKCHKRTHTGERPFRCDVCGASFARSTTLRIHKRTHTGERPFRCHICGASFTRSNSLKNHMRTHLGK